MIGWFELILQLQTAQYQMSDKVNSTPIYVQEMFFDKFLCPHIVYNSVLVYQSSEYGDTVEIVSKSKLSTLIGCEQKVVQTPST